MFEDFKVANYPKSLVSPELYARPLARLFSGDVIDGFTVTPGTGLKVVLAPGNAMIRYGSAAVASARIASLVANFNLTIETADVSNPRIDLVVLYIDNAVNLPDGTPSTANLDGKGVAKAKIVKGTAAATPAAPNATAIQSSVGAGNPYTVLAQVRVNAGVSVIAANQIADVRDMARTRKVDLTAYPATTVDVNGWAVTDYGTHKEATKLVSNNRTKVRFETEIFGSVNLPAGVSSSGLKKVDATLEPGTNSESVSITRINMALESTVTQIQAAVMYLGGTSATSYVVPVRFYAKW
mgnify:CR=1 FL=1